MYKDEFFIRWNYHLLAAPGYVVLMTNYSGSTGFGEAFAQKIEGDPLKGPADEINQAADEAIKRYPFIDASRQAAGGASYGGHLTNWLAVSTDRYRALVSHAGLYDLKTQWTTSDIAYSRERGLGGPPWEGKAVWKEQSPFWQTKKLKTPILLSFGERDFRVPYNNGLEFFMLLQRQQVESRLVIFPDENHWVLKGEDSRYFYQEVQDWLATPISEAAKGTVPFSAAQSQKKGNPFAEGDCPLLVSRRASRNLHPAFAAHPLERGGTRLGNHDGRGGLAPHFLQLAGGFLDRLLGSRAELGDGLGERLRGELEMTAAASPSASSRSPAR